ncbi:hypothetical protein [Xanthomonas cassavae]|uniref:hypothetical protein n=1 Tax=Xanthomonas cassavae TaxID=56450 RepID=UPI001F1C283D|nr:hypothetical protein [Xanthomonas cassavae]
MWLGSLGLWRPVDGLPRRCIPVRRNRAAWAVIALHHHGSKWRAIGENDPGITDVNAQLMVAAASRCNEWVRHLVALPIPQRAAVGNGCEGVQDLRSERSGFFLHVPVCYRIACFCGLARLLR